MKQNRKFLSLALLFVGACCLTIISQAQTPDYTRYVNPFIGTGGHGHTFPGAVLPFGMVQLSPDTREANWDGSSGYHYSDDIIYGFSHTHLSGTGIPDGCDILFMPTVGRQLFTKVESVSKFSHVNEKAEPGFYSVKLDDGILAELTTTKRVGFHRYSYPKGSDANLILDLKWRDKVISQSLKIVGNKRVEGFRRSTSWAKDQIVYFVAEFSRAFNPNEVDMEADSGEEPEQRGGKFNFRFNAEDGNQLLVKVAISSVSIEGARRNLAAELPGWDFDKVRADAKTAWNKELSKIEVSGGTKDQLTTFYTALYHTMIHPSLFSDVDGNYRGLDGKIHNINTDGVSSLHVSKGSYSNNGNVKPPANAGRSDNYSVFSLWDTFRAAHPLYTIIEQKRTVDFINTFIRMYEQGGRLPVWELWGNETDTMIGYHAVSVIADAMAKGIKGFDYEKAYEAAQHSAELDHFGLAAYKKRGYISMEDENESVSRTLEYAYDDWCIAQMARILGKNPGKVAIQGNRFVHRANTIYLGKEVGYYEHRARSFQNLFDPTSGFMRPKKNGGFVEPFAPNEVTFGFTEGNSWQYSFFVPQDAPRLIGLYGSRDNFIRKMTELFTTEDKLAGREQADLTGLIGQYAHGNEPSHHIAYLFNVAGEPWLAQQYARRIMDEFYKPTPDGLIGNEDCGQMSAWYVLSASGFYQIAPGDPVYAIGSPLFKEVKFHLENGKTFTIKAPETSGKNIYVRSMKINGVERRSAFFKNDDIQNGSTVEFAMSDQPLIHGYPAFMDFGEMDSFVAVPVIDGGKPVFRDKTTIALRDVTRKAEIHYTTDGSEPLATSTLYASPITIDASSTIKAIAVNSRGDKSLIAEAEFHKAPNDWTVKVTSGYSRQYTGGGDNAIVDGIRGTTNFASGEWQGIQGRPYEAVIDLQRTTEINVVGAEFLQVAGPWIWMPDRVEFEVSTDGVNFSNVAEIKPGFPQREMTPTVHEYDQRITPTKARFVRIRAYNIGKIPAWHPGAGGDPWIFIDEVIIR